MADLDFFLPSQILTFLCAIISGIVLIVRADKSRPSLYLGLFLIAYTMDLFLHFLIKFDVTEGREYLYFLPLSFWFISAPLLYFYLRELVRPTSLKERLIHAIPGILEFGILTVLFIITYFGIVDAESLNPTSRYGAMETYFQVGLAYSIVYYVISIITARKYRAQIDNYFSERIGKNLYWIESICYLIIFQILAWMLIYHIEDPVIYDMIVATLYMINMVIIIWILYRGLKQDTIEHSPLLQMADSDQMETHEPPAEGRTELFDQIVELIENEQLYLKQDLKVNDISNRLGESSRTVSEMIKSVSGKNFSRFINMYRVNEAKKILESEKADRLTMEAIAYDSGFNSRTTFYTVFKKLNNCSPAQYRKRIA